MKTNILATAVALSDRDLLARIHTLARTEREAAAELVAHLAALELRPALYLSQGHGSLFDYCTRALRLSEDAACNRIEAARACRRFPAILDLLASGSLTLTSVRKLGRHLTEENHETVLGRALNRTRDEIDALVAELAPRPDVRSSVRKVPARETARSALRSPTVPLFTPAPNSLEHAANTPRVADTIAALADGSAPLSSTPSSAETSPPDPIPEAPALPACPRPIVRASAPERYHVQFTIDQQTHDKLRRIQALLCREVPNGDPAAIFDHALDALLEKVERAKLGMRAKPRRAARGARPLGRAYETRIRPGTDRREVQDARGGGVDGSRHIPNAVKRAVWCRDAGQCAFVSESGRRCLERKFLELHHIQPYALDGPPTINNISLRCRRHNQYEAEIVFGSRARSKAEPREALP
jgi:5-methylcytosine-specific restriction endonuclease McrA